MQRLVAPVNVLDFAADCAKNPDFLLTIDHVKAWEAKHGAIKAGEWVVLRTDWDKRSHDADLFLNADATGPHTPGPTAEVIEYLIAKGIVGWGSQCIGTDAGQAGGMTPPFPGAQPFAQEQPLRSGEPCQSGQAAGQGGDPDCGPPEDQERHRLAHPCAGAGAAIRCAPPEPEVSAATPPRIFCENSRSFAERSR